MNALPNNAKRHIALTNKWPSEIHVYALTTWQEMYTHDLAYDKRHMHIAYLWQ